MASGILSFTSNEVSPWADGVAEDGEGGSTDLAGKVIQIGLLKDTNGNILNTPIEWQSESVSGFGVDFSGLTTYEPQYNDEQVDVGWAGFVIKSADLSEFQINGFQWMDWGYAQDSTGEPINVTGYRDGKPVASSTFNSNNSPTVITVNLNSQFDAVDEVRIMFSSAHGWATINTIEIADAAIDTAPPDTTITASPASLTNSSSATFVFTSNEPGSTYSMSLDGGAFTAATSPKTFSGLADGAHTVMVRAHDAAGNVDPTPATYTWTVDTTAPTVTITSSKPSLKVGETATITFTFSEDPGSSFSWDGTSGDIAVSGGTLSAISGTGTTRTATFTPNANTDAGSASIRVLAGTYQDLAGNDGTASNNRALSYDTKAPNAPSIPSLTVSDDSGASSSDYVTNKDPLTFSGTAEAGATVKLYDGAAEIASVTASGGTYTIQVTGLEEGNHTLTAVAFDAAGNASTASGGLAVTVDRTPPTTTIASAMLSADTGASVSDMITSIAPQTISGTLSANLAAGEQVMVSLDNGATWNPVISSVGTNTWQLVTMLSGSGVLQVQVVDLAGNAGTTYTHAYALDTVAPGAPSRPDLDTGSDSGNSDTDDITGVTQPTFSGTAETGSIVRIYEGATEIGHTTVIGTTWQITPDQPLSEGSHTITAKATDLAGNVSDASQALTVQILTAGPLTTIQTLVLSSDSGVVGDFITNANAQTLSGTLSSVLAAGERVQVSLDGGHGWTDAASAAGSNAWSLPVTLTAGDHDIRVRVLNAVDNSGPVRVQAYTLDSSAPTLALTNPIDNATNVSTSADLTLTFSEAVHKGVGTIELHTSNGTVIESFDAATSNRVSIAGNVLTVDPTSPLTSATGYYLTISAGALTDLAGNSFAGFADTTTFNFTTAAPIGPVVTPNEHGGREITITDPGQLTADLGTSGTDTVLYAGLGTVTLPNTVENIRLSGAGDANAVGNGLMNFFQGNAGDNLFDGAAGKDAIFYDVSLADVSLSYNADGTLTISGARIGTDTIKNVELLHFADQVVLANPPPAHTPGLFNEAWYLGQNPDVAAAVKAGTFSRGFEHFLKFGAQEGRAAAPGSSGWDEQFYLAHNPDVAAAVKMGALASGFEHFLKFGAQEGRAATADGEGWNEDFYLQHNPDVAAAVKAGGLASGLEHFLQNGGPEGRAADPQALGVDEAFYLAQNPDVAAAVQAGWLSSGMDHYFTWGAREGRDPNAMFDEAWYLSHNLDVAAAVQAGGFASGYDHYQHFGWSEGRDPSAWFDVSAYLAANPDVATAHVDPLTHYLTYGVREGRTIVAAGTDLWV
ncbi:Ig-like domain-containing protein [Microvirga calopogonii]|uniref:Ig-like domain-containing protein n=1 Tax=Microvirga calopogonii TaxID=2078013 RepID=UPI000E0DECA9|nr:Ig-like domain-containing protein [Microvirga calopogonii]